MEKVKLLVGHLLINEPEPTPMEYVHTLNRLEILEDFGVEKNPEIWLNFGFKKDIFWL